MPDKPDPFDARDYVLRRLNDYSPQTITELGRVDHGRHRAAIRAALAELVNLGRVVMLPEEGTTAHVYWLRAKAPQVAS